MSTPALIPVLASASRYRRELLQRICPEFDAMAADVDERPRPGETPVDTVVRLAAEKAQAIARIQPGRLVIGSDQLADLGGRMLGKPGNRHGAIAQLAACNGRQVHFHTAICLRRDQWQVAHLDRTTVHFRTLDEDEIERYVDLEQPYDCAGSFKVEALGVCLFDAIETQDPTALIGLPLIATCRLLRAAGYDPLRPQSGSQDR